MGQAVSRRVMPHLSKAINKHEQVMAKDALDDIARKQAHARATNNKYTDPSAMQGFKRDQWTDVESLPSERGQADFLSQQSSQAPQEMPDDLIKFLNDAGPLERKVDKELTSPKVYDSLLEEEEVRKQQQDSNRQRRRRMLPMMGEGEGNTDVDADSISKEKLDGTTVSRTTNFSTVKKEEKETEIRLDDDQMFQLLSKLQTGMITPDAYVEENKNEAMTVEQIEENVKILQYMLENTSIPTLMQDDDKSYVGAWHTEDRIEKLKLMGVRMAGNEVQLSFEQKILGLMTKESVEDLKHAAKSQQPSHQREKMSTAEFLRRAKQDS